MNDRLISLRDLMAMPVEAMRDYLSGLSAEEMEEINVLWKPEIEEFRKSEGHYSDASAVLEWAVAETAGVRERERAGERIDGSLQGFRMRDIGKSFEKAPAGIPPE